MRSNLNRVDPVSMLVAYDREKSIGLPTLTVERQLLQMEPESNYYAELEALVVCDLQVGQRGRKFLGVRAVANPSGNTKFPRPRVRGSAPRPYGDHPSTSPRQTNKQTNKQTSPQIAPKDGTTMLSFQKVVARGPRSLSRWFQ